MQAWRVDAGGGEACRNQTSDRMEQIRRADNGGFFYGDKFCPTADDAYLLYRRDYDEGTGRAVFKRLGRIGQRTERIHGFGFDFERKPDGLEAIARIPYRLMGLLGIHYCRIIGCWNYSGISEYDFEWWFDRVFSRGSGLLRRVGTNDKAGRTSKGRKRYR